jgi:hypothetical protein
MGVWGGGSQQRIPPRDASNPLVQTPNFTAPNMYSQLAFGFTQFDVEHLLVYMIWNDDMEEDSIIPWVPMMRDQAAYGAARALDRTILDGDETATHRDFDVTASNDFRKAIYGLRKMCTANDLDASGATFDLDDIHTLRTSLGIYGKDPSKLRLILPLKLWYQLVGNTAASSSGDILRRVDTIGPRATVLSGQVAEPYGIPLIVSEPSWPTRNASRSVSSTSFGSRPRAMRRC